MWCRVAVGLPSFGNVDNAGQLHEVIALPSHRFRCMGCAVSDKMYFLWHEIDVSISSHIGVNRQSRNSFLVVSISQWGNL